MLTGQWLMSQDAVHSMIDLHQRASISDERVQAFMKQVSSRDPNDMMMVDESGAAHIPIIGVLSKSPSFMDYLFDGGSAVYGDIVKAVQAADNNPEVNKIILEIDSPGGDVDGFFDAAKAIENASKPTEAHVNDMAASAAYGLAAQADAITVNGPMAHVGSVGIVTRQYVSDSVVTVTSTDAPNKAPDASTDEGIAAIRKMLDPIHDQFAGAIAAGRSRATARNITLDSVNADFGRGAPVIAAAALKSGMIDSIKSAEPAKAKAPTKARMKIMDPNELKTEHPALYAQVMAEGRTVGATAERKRVSAHLKMGLGFGAMKAAIDHIASGADFGDPEVQADYLTARHAASDLRAREHDDDDAGTGKAPAKKTEAGVDMKEVLRLAAEGLGVDVNKLPSHQAKE